ncbi:MAG: tRNA 2-thiocytidine(32) synthetase TtcA [Firmicutes bacterium]|nr:tRNA 2-thiocytidine(32) synthetase TtcA [Bacillota bacterium]
MKKIISNIRRAIEDYKMINAGDKIAVGLSGGKDSLTLLFALSFLKKHIHKNFELIAVTVDCTNGETDYTTLKKWCSEICSVELIVEKCNIFQIIFNERQEKNPCSLCSKMRRGVLNTVAIANGCNKIALGHHADDLNETLFLSMFYEGRLSTFAPVSFLDRTNITLIRPLLYIFEQEIINNVESVKKQHAVKGKTPLVAQPFPIINNCCAANGNTKRDYIKQLIKQIEKDIPTVKERILDAITNPSRYNLFNKLGID